MRKCLMHVGMDVHKDSIEIAIAEDGRNQEVRRGRIDRELGSLDRVVRKLVSTGKQLRFVYEAARAHRTSGDGLCSACFPPPLYALRAR